MNLLRTNYSKNCKIWFMNMSLEEIVQNLENFDQGWCFDTQIILLDTPLLILMSFKRHIHEILLTCLCNLLFNWSSWKDFLKLLSERLKANPSQRIIPTRIQFNLLLKQFFHPIKFFLINLKLIPLDLQFIWKIHF